MRKQLKTLLVFLSLAPSSSLADGICQASGRCEGASSNIEYKECLARLGEEQDKELNRLYAKVQELLSGFDAVDSSAPKVKPQMIQTQKAWLQFRDSQCELEYGMAQGGTAGGGYYSDCVCHLTFHRNEDLRRMLSTYGE